MSELNPSVGHMFSSLVALPLCSSAHTCRLVLSCPVRLVCRDIGGSDPERMAAPRVADYVQDLFRDSPVKVGFVRLTTFFFLCVDINY